MKIPIRTALPLLAILLLMVGQVWVSALWIQADGGIGDGVCCSFTAPVLEILRAEGTGQLGWPWSTYRQSMGLLVWPALGARKIVGANPDFLLWLNLAVVLLTQVLLFDLGRRLADRFSGLLAAGLYPMIPAITFMAHRWDAMVHQNLVLVAAAWFAVRSQGFSRLWATVGFGAVAAIGSVLSARETDNLLFMAAVGAISVGAFIQGLFGPAKVRTAIGTAALAGIMAWFMVNYAFPLVDFAYFQDEMGNSEYVEGASRLSIAAVTAYPLRMYSDDFTPWLIAPFLLALIPFLRRGRGRWILSMWLLLPLIALSMVGKKNFYYAAPVYPVIPLVVGIGFASFKPRAIGLILGIGTLVVSWAQFSARSLPTSTFPASLSSVEWTGAAGPQKHLFQGIVPLHLGPRGATDHFESIELLVPRIEEDSCACPNHTLFMGQGDASDLHLAMAVKDPCMALSTWPRLDHPDSVGFVVIESTGCKTKPPPILMRAGFDVIDAKGEGEHCVALWRRTKTEPPRFCGHKGSPPE